MPISRVDGRNGPISLFLSLLLSRFLSISISVLMSSLTLSLSFFLSSPLVEWAPARGDLSGFLWLLPVFEQKRRLSLRGQRSKKDYVWVVLDGQLLTWADSVDGKELG